jgi:hypothetical protein
MYQYFLCQKICANYCNLYFIDPYFEKTRIIPLPWNRYWYFQSNTIKNWQEKRKVRWTWSRKQDSCDECLRFSNEQRNENKKSAAKTEFYEEIVKRWRRISSKDQRKQILLLRKAGLKLHIRSNETFSSPFHLSRVAFTDPRRSGRKNNVIISNAPGATDMPCSNG